jgi:hypothetical protein
MHGLISPHSELKIQQLALFTVNKTQNTGTSTACKDETPIGISSEEKTHLAQ